MKKCILIMMLFFTVHLYSQEIPLPINCFPLNGTNSEDIIYPHLILSDNMKLKLFFYLCMLPFLCLAQETQPQQFSNRYGMKMKQNEDGSYSLLYAKKYAKLIDVNTIPDVMTPYTYQANRLKSKDYKGVITKDIVYKKYEDYELILTVDFAETDNPAPFVVYLHGGGWARGNNGSSRSLSQYLAKQKGITGVRVSYTLAPQSDATVKVSIQDVWDAVKYIREHAAELNINPECFGFLGTSAGAHLAAVAAMTVPGTKAFVGYSGIYDLEKAAIIQKTKDPQRIGILQKSGCTGRSRINNS